MTFLVLTPKVLFSKKLPSPKQTGVVGLPTVGNSHRASRSRMIYIRKARVEEWGQSAEWSAWALGDNRRNYYLIHVPILLHCYSYIILKLYKTISYFLQLHLKYIRVKCHVIWDLL